MTRILVVEDEPALCQLLVNNLSFLGYSVEAVGDGMPALAAHASRRADLIVLDLMLPRMDGFAVLEMLRKQDDEVPVLMLTARGEEADRLRGLRLGADDYVVKPFSILELMARVQAVLRRVSSAGRATVRKSGPFHFNLLSQEAQRDGKKLNLTQLEFRLLMVLVNHAGGAISRKELLHLAWAPDARPTARTVDVHVASLRKKLGEEESTSWIGTVGGVGYIWLAAVEKG